MFNHQDQHSQGFQQQQVLDAQRQLAFDDDEEDAAPRSVDRAGGHVNHLDGDGSAPRTAARRLSGTTFNQQAPNTQEAKGVQRRLSSSVVGPPSCGFDAVQKSGFDDTQANSSSLFSPNPKFSQNHTDSSGGPSSGGTHAESGSPLDRLPQQGNSLFAPHPSSDDRHPGFAPRNIFAEGFSNSDRRGGGVSSREGSGSRRASASEDDAIPFSLGNDEEHIFHRGQEDMNAQNPGVGMQLYAPQSQSGSANKYSYGDQLMASENSGGGPGGGSPLSNVQPGRLLFEYSNHLDIGSGDFGAVVAATYDEDGVTYAIKSSKKPAVGERELQSRLQEVYALSACSSPYLLRYYDAWVEQGHVSIKTEYLADGAVRQLPKPWAEEQLWLLLLQVSLGLHALHSNNITHLDVKPDNIFVDLQSNASYPMYRLGDFGLARPVKDHSPVGEHFDGLNEDEGDCRYLCPELLKHSYSLYLMEADVYSLGASVVDLAGGDPVAFRNDGYTEFTSDYSDHLKNFLASMLNPHPPSRPTAFQVVEMTTKAVAQLFKDGSGETTQQANSGVASEFALLNHPQVTAVASAYQQELQQLEEEYQRLLQQQQMNEEVAVE